MTLVAPTLNLPSSATSASAATAVAAPPAPSAAPAPAAKTPNAPSTTVTLSPQGMSALAAASHPPTPSAAAAATAPAAAAGGSVYEALKNGISSAVSDVEGAIAGGAHAVVDGVGTVITTANDVAKGILELPFAVVAKACDAVGAVIDEL